MTADFKWTLFRCTLEPLAWVACYALAALVAVPLAVAMAWERVGYKQKDSK